MVTSYAGAGDVIHFIRPCGASLPGVSRSFLSSLFCVWPMLKRAAFLLILLAGGCDPMHYAYFAVSPRPQAAPDSEIDGAFRIVERIAARHGFSTTEPTDGEQKWRSCVGVKGTRICGKVVGNEAQFMMSQWGGAPRGFGAVTDSLRQEILDSLRTNFGREAVRECRWRASTINPSLDGCPVAGADSTRG